MTNWFFYSEKEMSELRFDGRVAIVTGAGAGLGRSHALMLAARGAKVVVNDLGGSAHGDGKSASAADKVVDEIRAAGGEAVANYDSVENGEAIVKTALDAFGTVDIVINNAGILRDVSFAKMSEGDWEIIMRVHLNGTKSVSHAAWPIMREKGYGRIIMTTSAAGIYGNFGQANYCAAKLGILGLANCLAEEGRSKNIFVNTIAPLAASRLTETIMPPDLLALLKPEAVSPLVAWLAHEDCQENKGLFEVGAGYVAKLRWERTAGYSFPKNKIFTLDDIARHWEKITDFSESTHPATTTESFMPILDSINNPSLGGNEFINLDLASKTTLELESAYDERDLALYALGIGAARDPLDKNELKYVYELGGDFRAQPTYGVMPQSNAMLAAAKAGSLSLPGMNFGFDRLLHGEQFTEIKRPLPPRAKLKHSFKLKHAYDKAPNAVVTFAISSTDETGEEIIYNEMTAFVKGAGGWGGDRGPSADVNVPPDRAPDAVIEEKTDANQTLLYRLSGDWNPLHADPDFAKAFGYERPILHGMCTYGYCGRHVIKAFCNNDERYFKNIKVRFAKSVFPGETLVTKMWKESPTRIVFETTVKERNEVVIKNAAIELYKEIPASKATVKNTAATASQNASKSAAASVAAEPARLIAADVFEVLTQYVAEHPELVEKTKTVFQFKLSNPDSVWTLDLKNGKGQCQPGDAEKADVTLEMDEAHLGTVVTSSLADVQKLFFGGKLKISGNVMASNKLVVLQEIKPQRFEDAKAKRIAAGGGAVTSSSATSGAGAQSTAAAPVSDKPVVADIFGAIAKYIGKTPGMGDQIKTVFQFNFTEPDSSWVLDLKAGNGSVSQGVADKSDVTLELSEANFIGMCTGAEDAQKLYFGGKMKVSGNVMASNKLAFLQKMDPQLVITEIKARMAAGATAPAQAAASASSSKRKAQAPEIFEALKTALEGKGQKNAGLNHIMQFDVREPDAVWSVDFSVSPATVVAAKAANAAVVFGIDDADLVALVRSKATPRDLYQHGKLRVNGDVALAKHLDFLRDLV
jgi:3-hydroxyacyl-CoA dehydrogenase/3a,7a,12a-trihydroxy-5b-cholest-24-enoyl-CoA hydratase